MEESKHTYDEMEFDKDEREYDLAYLTSRPLVRITKVQGVTKSQPIEELDLEAERDLLHAALRESGKSVRIRAEVATVSNLRTLITLGCKALHYSGHGFERKLAFEDTKGQMHSVTDEVLCDLVGAGEEKFSKLQFVFVSACYSQAAGEAFARAGVPHVVAVQFDTAVSDVASRVFFQQFYLALLVGKTVREAFDIGKAAVKSDSQVIQKREADIFLLLPDNKNHDVVIFDHLKRGKWKYLSPQEEIENRIPACPENFIGRERETQSVYSAIIDKRMVTVFGEKGIGKTALVKCVSQYAFERAATLSLQGVFFIDLSKSNILEREYATSMGAICWYAMKSRSQQQNQPPCHTNRDFYDEMRDRRYLLVIDAIDSFNSEHIAEELNPVKFLKDLLETCRSIRVLATARQIIDHVDLNPKSINLLNLTRKNGAKLFLKLKSRNLNHEDFMELDAASSKFKHGHGSDKLESLANHKLLVLCNGQPSLIAQAAALLRPNRRLREVYQIMAKNLHGSESKHMMSGPSPPSYPISPPSHRPDSGEIFWYKYISKDSTQAKLKNVNEILKQLFNDMTYQNRPLSNEDLRIIETKLRADKQVVYREYFVDFYPWFQAVIRIIRKCRDLWEKGIIYGLISKEDAHKTLMNEKEGVFIVRFSSNRESHVALAYKDESEVTHTVIEMTHRGFEIEVEDGVRFRYNSLEEVIYNLIPLTRVMTKDMKYIPKGDLVNNVPLSRRDSSFNS